MTVFISVVDHIDREFVPSSHSIHTQLHISLRHPQPSRFHHRLRRSCLSLTRIRCLTSRSEHSPHHHVSTDPGIPELLSFHPYITCLSSHLVADGFSRQESVDTPPRLCDSLATSDGIVRRSGSQLCVAWYGLNQCCGRISHKRPLRVSRFKQGYNGCEVAGKWQGSGRHAESRGYVDWRCGGYHQGSGSTQETVSAQG